MKKINLVLYAVLLFLTSNTLWAQQTIQSDKVVPFNKLNLIGNLSVELIASDENKVHIIHYDVDIKRFNWSVNKGELKMENRTRRDGVRATEVKIYYSDTLQNITISGCDLVTNGLVGGNVLGISITNDAKVSAEISVDEMELYVSGNSVVQIKGVAKYVLLRAVDRSVVNIMGVENASLEVEANGAAEVHVTAFERFVVNAKSTATVFYKGSPRIYKNITSKISSNMMGSSVLNVGVQ